MDKGESMFPLTIKAKHFIIRKCTFQSQNLSTGALISDMDSFTLSEYEKLNNWVG
jgi:hypothetical protein